MANSKMDKYTRIFIVFVILAILTIVEYFVGAVENPSAIFLNIIALLKAGIVVYEFMHVYRLWREDDH